MVFRRARTKYYLQVPGAICHRWGASGAPTPLVSGLVNVTPGDASLPRRPVLVLILGTTRILISIVPFHLVEVFIQILLSFGLLLLSLLLLVLLLLL